MIKKSEREQCSSLENLEDQKYKELQAAMDEENRVMREINDVLASTQDRAGAEKIVLEKYAPLMGEAMKKSSEILRAWLDFIRESSEREGKEFDDMGRDSENK